jgi:hypothetical protein
MKHVRSFALLAISLLLLGGMLTAQQSTGKIFGIVQLDDGSLVPGVNVEATSSKLVGKATAVTDENGTFRLVNLTPGTYKVVFTLQGFQTVVRDNVTLNAEQTLNLKVEIKLGNIEEAITITGQTALIDVKSTSKGMTLTKEMFDVLPKGRNFDGLVAVIPGALTENLVGGLSIDGSSGGENMFYVDGQNTNSVFGGQGAQQAAFDFVDEVQIKASGYQAEFGGSLGGVINVVTRSGGNEFHGDVVGYYSGSAIRGKERNTIINDPSITQPTLREFNYSDRGQELTDSRLEGGFGLGGYIIKDKLWFYINALPVFRANTQPAIYLVTADPAHLKSTPFTDPAVLNIYSFDQTNNDLNFQAKLSAQPFKNMRMSASFVNNYNVWSGGLPSRAGSSSDGYDFNALGYGFPNYSVSGNIDYTVGNNFMISARAGYFFLGVSNKLDPAQANTAFDPQYSFTLGNLTIDDVPQALRRPSGFLSRSTQSMLYPFEVDEESNLSAGADFTYFLNLAGEHAWKAGLAFTRANVNKSNMQNGPLIIFSGWRNTTSPASLSRVSVDVRGGSHSRVNEFFPHTGQYGEFGNVSSNRLALYLQDSWTIANRLTLNFGVRLEQENVPSFNDDPAYEEYWGRDVVKWGLLDKVSPRVGFVYDVMGDSSFKVYGSFGIYNDTMELDMALGSFGGMRWISDFYYIDGPNFDKIFDFGKIGADGTRDYSAGRYRGSTNYRSQYWSYLDPDLKPMAQSEMTFGLEKKLSDDLSLSARGTWRKLIRTIDDVGLQVPNAEGSFDEMYKITNPGYGYSRPVSQGGLMSDDFWPCPKAFRDYKALNLSLEKRMSNNWMGGVNLTLSRLWGNYTGIVSGDEAIAGTMGTGRPDGNVTRYFDIWWMAYKSNGKEELNTGVLPTDRPVVVKAYGSYVFPFGLTIGGVADWMMGTPRSTEFYIDTAAGYYPLGRNDMGRTPSLWFLNLYAEYNLKLGKNTLQFSVNVDNVTNNDTGIYYYNCINNRSVYTYWNNLSSRGSALAIDGDTIATIKNGYDLFAMEGTWPQASNKWTRDPRYGKAILFQAPITARLGVKFIF